MATSQHAVRMEPGFEASRVDVDLLLFFAAVAEELSFTRAARRLEIDQSWLSHKIRQLEGELSCTLFTRTTRRIALTGAGRALLQSSRALAQAAGEARRAAAAVSAGLRGTLRIGALPYSFLNPERVSLVDRFIRENPETELDVCTGPSTQSLEKLRLGELDLAFVSWPFETSGLEILQVRIDQFLLLIPQETPLAARSEVRMRDLEGLPMVMPNAQHNPYTFRSLYQPFVDAGVEPVMSAEFQRDAMLRLARVQRALLICHRHDAHNRCGADFVLSEIADHTPTNRKCLVRRRNYITPAIEEFWAMAGAEGCKPIEPELV